MDNLDIYNALRNVPADALKAISAGRLKGKSDINPMWRIKALTEQFGACGIGWKYEIVKQWSEPGANGEMCAFCNINLHIKSDGKWSESIPGTGGSMMIAKESKGLYTSDECYKMALTDAISVACKALGVAADVYWDKDRTKYETPNRSAPQEPIVCCGCGAQVADMVANGKTYTAQKAVAVSVKKYEKPLCWKCMGELSKNADNG